MKVWINGRPGALLDARDRGLQYGDGVFETMRVRRRGVRLLDFHLERLFEGCARLMIDPPDERRLRREIDMVAGRRQAAVLKLIVTRGVGARGYRPSGLERSTRLMMLDSLPRTPPRSADGPVRVRVCATRLGANPRLAGMKTLNRLESVVARSEWSDARIREGLMLDGADHVVCGTMSNVFSRRGDVLMTPLLDRCGVAGVMRRWVLGEAAALGLRPIERRLRLDDFTAADEVFITNAILGVVSVSELIAGRTRSRIRIGGTAALLRTRLEAH
jgi:4-amino-4-deoxychorismate lyase